MALLRVGFAMASRVTAPPVRSYRTLSSLPVEREAPIGGLLSVALSLSFGLKKTSPGGRYPPPLFRGARTFLARLL